MKLRDVIKKHFSHIDISEIMNEIINYRHSIFSKNQVNIDWLSSNLSGVHAIRFTDSDAEDLFYILDIDPNEFKRDYQSVNGINKEWKVSSNPFYGVIGLFAHIILNSRLSKEKQDILLTELFYIFSFKLMTSFYSNYYKYQVSIDVAKKVYDRMSNKFLIKKYGSNFAVIDSKKKIFTTDSKNAQKRLKNIKPATLVHVLNDVSGSYRGFVQSAYELLLEVLEESEKNTTISLHIEGEDGERLVEIENRTQDYFRIGRHLILYKEDLIKHDILELISDLIRKSDIVLVENTLTKMSELALHDPDGIFEITDYIFDSTLFYLYKTELYPPYDQTFPTLIKYLKNYWSNSKVQNEHLRSAKESVQDIIMDELGITNHSKVITTSIVVCIYIFARAVLDKKIIERGT